jgi:hypothetical protein
MVSRGFLGHTFLMLLLPAAALLLQADILVSELLGSFGDNELSPE